MRRLDPQTLARALRALPPHDLARVPYCWPLFARPAQLAPDGEWSTWLVLGGRGAGKTRSGAEFVRDRVERGLARRISLVGATAADVRDTMVEGPSGLLSVSPPWARPRYEPSKRKVTWPNGAVALLFSADEPDRLRGPQCDTFWADELAAWRFPDAWDQLQLGFRLGDDPRGVVTTTPRPTPIVKQLLADPGTRVTRESTYANRANLSPRFFEAVIRRYEGSRLGRQELLAEVLDEVEGALWTAQRLDALRVGPAVLQQVSLVRVVVGVDPAVSAGPDSAETGIVVCAKASDGGYFVLEDASGRRTAEEWGRKVVEVARAHLANLVVAERNNGGDLVEANLRVYDRAVPVKLVTATKGKRRRAEPIAALYEQRRVRHVGAFPTLEDQMTSYVPGMEAEGFSPDRMDALVWALTELDSPSLTVGGAAVTL